MIEILFKGKRVDNGEWVEGNLCLAKFSNTTMATILIPCKTIGIDIFDVIPETVGQYTGLTDKNGKKIFEGDIILYGLIPCVVKYDTDNARFMLYEYGKYLKNGFNVDTMKLKEVIGNIHDNPELLKGGVDNV